MTPIQRDLINASFELVAGVALWMHVPRVMRDKIVRGVHPLPTLLFAVWALWNVYYYHSLGQPLSSAAAVMPLVANTTWLVLYLWYRR